jgi:outer membrane protein assembly factor BamA
MKRTITTAVAAIMLCIPAFAYTVETNEAEKEAKKEKKAVQYNENGEIIKTGLNYGPLPVVAFDADRGFQYGALLNIYNFGDGSTYPNPKSWWYIEASAYTGGTWNLFLNYDNMNIGKDIRLSICTNYNNESALDFYGFNGYQSIYAYAEPDFFKNNPDLFAFDESKKGQKAEKKFDSGNGKIPNGFYRYSRQSLRVKADLTGKIAKNFFWEAGYTFYWINHKEFKPEGYTVKDGSLYQLYKDWGILNDTGENQYVSALKAGLMYDTRNIQNNPTKGIWAEAHAIVAPKWLGSSMDSYKISATFRHYVPIVKDKLTFAYRLAYQAFLGSNTPWYLMPFYSNMGYTRDYDAIGGYRTTRGLMLDRVQGLHTGFYNLEFRYKFIDFQLWNQNIAFALSAFTDGAHVFKGYDLTNRNEAALAISAPHKNELYKKYINTSKKDGLHASAGAGLRFIMNQNFIVAFEYAQCFNRQDGKGAFYINTGFLF